MHMVMPNYYTSMPVAAQQPPQHAITSRSHNNNISYSASTAAAMIADAASNASFFHHVMARAPVSQWQKQQRGRGRAHTTANDTLAELTSKLTMANTTTAANSVPSNLSSTTTTNTNPESTRMIWPFEQSVEDQADFASRVIYALWCGNERPASLPNLSNTGLPITSSFDMATSTTNDNVITLDHWSISSFADYLCGQPAPSDYRQFCHEILRVTQLHPSVILLALYYVYRLVFLNPEIRGAAGSEMRVWTVALALANKYLDDHTYRASTWRQLTGLSTKELTQMEFEMLQALCWSLHITPESFKSWSHWLVQLRKRYNDDQQLLKEQTLAIEEAMLLSPITTTPNHGHLMSMDSTFNPALAATAATGTNAEQSRSKRHWRHMSSEDIYTAMSEHNASIASSYYMPSAATEFVPKFEAEEPWANTAVQRRRTSRYGCMPTAWSSEQQSSTSAHATASRERRNTMYHLPMDVTMAGSVHGKPRTANTVHHQHSMMTDPSDELIYSMATDAGITMSMMRQAHNVSASESADTAMPQFFHAISNSSSLMTTPSNMQIATAAVPTAIIAPASGTADHCVSMAGPLTPAEGQLIDPRLANIRAMAAVANARSSHATQKSVPLDSNGNGTSTHTTAALPLQPSFPLNDLYATQHAAQSLVFSQQQQQYTLSSQSLMTAGNMSSAILSSSRADSYQHNSMTRDCSMPTPLVDQTMTTSTYSVPSSSLSSMGYQRLYHNNNYSTSSIESMITTLPMEGDDETSLEFANYSHQYGQQAYHQQQQQQQQQTCYSATHSTRSYHHTTATVPTSAATTATAVTMNTATTAQPTAITAKTTPLSVHDRTVAPYVYHHPPRNQALQHSVSLSSVLPHQLHSHSTVTSLAAPTTATSNGELLYYSDNYGRGQHHHQQQQQHNSHTMAAYSLHSRSMSFSSSSAM